MLNAVMFLASTAQSESDPLSNLLEQLQELMPPGLWAALFIVVALCLFALDIGDKYSGIFGSPFQRSQPSTDQLKDIRCQLLTIVKKEVNLRLANSLHNLVKLDLYMEEQRQRVGNPKYELVPEDTEPGFQAVNRVLHPKGNKTPLDLKLTQKIIEVFERQDIQGKLLILGEPGSGKTTELLQLAQDLVTRVEENERQAVPLILELSSWRGETINRWVVSQVKKLYNISESITQQWLASDQILLLLDGLDELGLTKQKQCIEKINQFLEITLTSRLVVCCRREEYEASEVALERLNGAIYLETLKEHQIYQYFKALNRLSLWSNVKGNLALLELAQKPLFLFMLVVAYQDNPIRNEQELFDAYIEKQLHGPDNQGAYKFRKAPTPRQTSHYLAWLAQQLETSSETEFFIEELKPTWLSSVRQKRLYKLIYGSIIGLLGGLMMNTLVIGLIIGLIVGLISELELAAKPREKMQWSPRNGVSKGLRVGLIIWLIIGLIIWLLGGLIAGLIYGLMVGLIIGLIVWLTEGLNSIPVRGREVPNQGIRIGIQNLLIIVLIFMFISGWLGVWFGGWLGLLLYKGIGDLIIGLMIGLLGGLMIGLMALLLVGVIVGVMSLLTGGLMGGVTGSLISGLNAAIQHFILRILLTINGYTPWNYARFLDQAVKHRFIQRTGGRYRFVHDLLRKHFAAMPLE